MAPHELNARKCPLPCLCVSSTTGIRHRDGNVAEVGAMTNRWLDTNFDRNTNSGTN